jgi:hypothetical protein
MGGQSTVVGADGLSLEFRITQDLDIIKHSLFAEPPQFAIWLEDPDTGKYKTVYVTRRSAAGVWVGKTECPDCLPRWFEIFRAEAGREGFPSQDNPVPDYVIAGPTPKTKTFAIQKEVAVASRWNCWVEMNLAGDFNDAYQEYDPEKKYVDVDLSGQPPLLFRANVEAHPGKTFTLELVGQVSLNANGTVSIGPVSEGITSARNVFRVIQVRVIGRTEELR